MDRYTKIVKHLVEMPIDGETGISLGEAVLDRKGEPMRFEDLECLSKNKLAYVRFGGKFLLTVVMGSILIYDMSKFSDDKVEILLNDNDPTIFDNDIDTDDNSTVLMLATANW